MTKSIALCVALAVCSTAGFASANDSGIEIGHTAPPLDGAAWLTSEPVVIEPGRIYVFNFFATWCGASRQSATLMGRVSRENEGRVTVVGVNVREAEHGNASPDAVRNYVTEQGPDFAYPILMDDPVTTPLFLGWMRQAGMFATPTAFIVDKSGHIAWIGIPNDNASVYPFEKALSDVVNGQHDVNAAKQVLADTQAEIAAFLADRQDMELIDSALERKDYIGAVREIRSLVAAKPEYRQRTFFPRVQALMMIDQQQALAFIDSELAHIERSEHAAQYNVIAGAVGQLIAGHQGLNHSVRERALNLIQKGLSDDSDPFGRVLNLLALADLECGRGKRIEAKAAHLSAIQFARENSLPELTAEMLLQMERDLTKYDAGTPGVCE